MSLATNLAQNKDSGQDALSVSVGFVMLRLSFCSCLSSWSIVVSLPPVMRAHLMDKFDALIHEGVN